MIRLNQSISSWAPLKLAKVVKFFNLRPLKSINVMTTIIGRAATLR